MPSRERILERIKTRDPSLYEEVKDLPMEDLLRRLKAMRGSRRREGKGT